MKARDMRELGADELAQRIREHAQEHRSLRLRHRSGSSVDRPLQIRALRRELARMRTIQRGREAGK